MDQIANLVIDLGIDAAEFKNEIPRIKNLLNGAASDAERSSARMQRFMERQTQAARQTMQAASSAATAASVHAQTVEKSAQAHERMAREVEQTRQRMEALSQKMREEQAQAMALAEAQDKAAAAFYRQIDSVKQAGAGLQELQRIQQQIRQARNSGGIGQQDYLALISEVTAKTRVLTQAEEEATRQKVAFIRQLKEQATRQNLSSSELLRAKAAQLGVSSAAEVYIRKMEQAGKATHSLGLKSAAARQEIGVLIGELARGNLGALRGSGITLANRAGWIDTLMSPKGMMPGAVIGGIAAAVYGLGKAWYDGQKEGEEFNRQLSLTGHYAGVTAGQLWTLSRAISGNGITQHAAAGALAQVVGSGAFRGNDIGMVARAAAQMERSVGQSVSDTINQFKRLKDDPVNAAKALDNELHFLTATQLEQIRVLGEQGRSSDAARIAMSALAEETGRRTADIDNNLNALGSTLKYLSDLWSRFWDAAMSLNRQLNENRRYWQQLEVVQGNWKNGVLRAFQDFTVDADNTAETAEQVFSSAFSNMGNGLATFVTTGKLNFKSFTSSVLSDMAKILAQATMMKSIKGIGSVLGFDLSSLSLNANGGIYQSADLSRYSGTVVNRPTFFAFAKGAGVMGEAGPEAILPLRRGADGKLGVVADIGGSGMAMFSPQYNIEINNDGTNGQIGPAALKAVYDLGKKAAADFMQQQARDGGRLSGAYR
ncbi:TPA: phage tail tape measure protein [Escherichia coli]